MRNLLLSLLLFSATALPAAAQDDEIVANLAGGRVIVHVTRDSILFAAIDHPLESKSIPPRVAEIDNQHIGIFLGAAEWQVPAQPKPIRLDHDIQRIAPQDPRYRLPDQAESDLEQIGVAFLERLRPLVTQLHHKIDLKPDEPLFEIVLLGYAPKDYGAEVWQIEYFVEQQNVAAQGDYWQTHILRPRFTQLYPPEKHQPKTILEIVYPPSQQSVPLAGLLQQKDPRILKIRNSESRLFKVSDAIERGEAQKSVTSDAADFLRAALPILAGDASYIMGAMSESGKFEWFVPPTEPVEKVPEDKNRPPEAPSLRRKPNP
jgi:hypothetical protein